MYDTVLVNILACDGMHTIADRLGKISISIQKPNKDVIVFKNKDLMGEL